LLLASTLFALGLVGLLVRRNVLFMLISLEVMLDAAGLVFVLAGAAHRVADGQVMFIFILAVAAAEVAVGLALVFQLHRRRRSLDADEAAELRG
jgi:NADH-quinone oxidoreductase subunit K